MLEQDSPLISVLVPTRNRATIVPETLDSVLAQTWEHFELVVSNNHSKDNTAAVLEEYARRDGRIRIVSPPEELAITDHWNWAWTQLRGTYTVLLSDDDVWEPAFLQTVTQIVKAHPDADVVATGYTYWYPFSPAKTVPASQEMVVFNGFVTDPLEPVLKHYLIKLECSLIRRDAFIEVGGYGPTLVGDMELWVKAALADKKFYYTNESLLKYRIHEGRTTDDQMHMHLAKMVETLPRRPGLTWKQRLRLRRAAGGLWAQAAKDKALSAGNPSPFAFYANGIKACPWHPANWVGMAQTLLRQPASK